MPRHMNKDEINEGGGLPEPGWHLARVSKCEERKAKATRDRYYNVALETPGGSFLAWDALMLEGKGNGIGFTRLAALGASEDLGDEVAYDTPEEIIGRRAYVYLTHEKWEGKTRCKVDIGEGLCGYLPETEPPIDEEGTLPMGAPPSSAAGEEDSEVPF